jgi:hypothetical protein
MTVIVYFQHEGEPLEIAHGIAWYLVARYRRAEALASHDMCARMFGYSDWRHLAVSHATKTASPCDAFVSADVLHQRVAHYLFVIERAGFSLDEAWKLIDAVTVKGWLGVGRFMAKPSWN